MAWAADFPVSSSVLICKPPCSVRRGIDRLLNERFLRATAGLEWSLVCAKRWIMELITNEMELQLPATMKQHDKAAEQLGQN